MKFSSSFGALGASVLLATGAHAALTLDIKDRGKLCHYAHSAPD